ncbi:SafA/ExsA family spore coat assembly protein, partial [Bacillus canaveralius]|uniref:SafA/ExsA family spore coat assembly protein n=2 Tax=Bacillus canaveralius TaxID=1403243 RepID=UPI0011592940
MKIHIVQKGDTLWKIAKKYGVNFEELKKMNTQLSNPDMIMPGMKIKVPTSGGTIKKEAPLTGGKPEAKISVGAKKEMPKVEHPLVKEKPQVSPVTEAPKPAPTPKKEAPAIEKQKEPVKEKPKAPYTPKMPQPVIPEIDINHYYTLNMANMSVEQPTEQAPLPQIPPKPTNILPGMMNEESPNVKEEAAPQLPKQQGGYKEPMYPYSPNFFHNSPAMPGHQQAAFPQQPWMPYPQVQGASMMPMQQMPPSYGVAGNQSINYTNQMDDESSPFMPQMPQMQSGLPTGVAGAEDYQMPPQMQGQYPQQVAGAQMPYAPMHKAPLGPSVAGAGFAPCPPPYGYPHLPPKVKGAMDYQTPYFPPQVLGAMDQQMPFPSQVGGAMDYQMPFPSQVGGAMDYQMPFPSQVGGAMDQQMPFPSQVGGAMDYQMPFPSQVGGAMDYQMPFPSQVGGAMDCQMPFPSQVGGAMDYQM